MRTPVNIKKSFAVFVWFPNISFKNTALLILIHDFPLCIKTQFNECILNDSYIYKQINR